MATQKHQEGLQELSLLPGLGLWVQNLGGLGFWRFGAAGGLVLGLLCLTS